MSSLFFLATPAVAGEKNDATAPPNPERVPRKVLDMPNAYPSPSVKQPVPRERFRELADWGSDVLTGDWNGARNFMGDHGVALNLRYVAIAMGNLEGGFEKGFFGGGPLGVTVTVDTESLIGWKGGTLFFDWEFFNWYNTRYPPDHQYDPTGSYVGSNTNFIEDTDKLLNQIAQLYYEQALFDDALTLVFGKMDSNVTYMSVGAAAAFQDSIAMYTSTVNPFFPTYPNEATALSGTFAPTDFFDVSVGWFDGTTAAYDPATGKTGPATGPRGPKTFFDNGGEWFLITQWNGHWSFDETRPGRAGIGAWLQTGRTATHGSDKRGVKNVPGAYLQWDQTVWAPSAESAAHGGGVRFFGQLGWSDPEKNPVEWSIMSGVSATGVIPGRPADAVGLMGAYSHFTGRPAIFQSERPNGASGPAGGSESSLEAFYLAQLTASVYVQPGVLWIRTPGGGDPAPLEDATMLYLLVGVDF